MSLGNPLGLLALGSIGVVLAIHLFQRRFRRRPITGLFLWHEGRRHTVSGRRVKPPPATISLFLECLSCTVLALLLAGARCDRPHAYRHCVFVLDGSASMSAVVANGERVTQRAAATVRELLTEYGGARVTIIRSGTAPRLLLGPEADAAQLEAGLEAWKPVDRSHDLMPAVSLARTLAGAGAPVAVLTDSIPAAPPAGVTWVSVGERLANAAFVGATRHRYDEFNDQIRLRVRAFGTVAAADVVVREGSDVVYHRTVSLQEEQELTFTVPADTGILQAELPDDALDLDNRVFLPPPPRKLVRCLNLHTGTAGLIIHRVLSCLDHVVETSESPADLYIGPGTALGNLPADSWVCAFGPFEEETAGTTFLGPYTIDARHPLLESVSLKGVAWHAPAAFSADSVPLIACGATALLLPAEAPYNGYRFNLSIEKTNLPRTPSWPVIFYNLVELRRSTLPGPDRTVLDAGTMLTLRMPPLNAETLSVKTSDGTKTVEYQEEIFLSLPPLPQVIELRAGTAPLYTFGVNWHDPEESNLDGLGPGLRQAPEPDRSEGGLYSRWGDPLFWSLVALLAGALFLNWRVTQRRTEP